MTTRIIPRWEIVHLLIPMHEVHETFMVIVVMAILGSINWELQIVWSKTVPLIIRIRKDPSLEQLVIRIVNPRDNKSRAKCKLFILCKEVVNVLIQHQTANGLQWHDVLRPGLCNVNWVKVKSVFEIGIYSLNKKFPLGIIACCN
ncbi:hypothetical protein D3Z37_19735 [Lachnospiraceae bacterium]|nr:hypothetical protein [Lachnospiraceae bacterium]